MKKIVYLLILSTLSFACSSLVEDLNTDPNNPTSASYSNILTGAEVGAILLQTGETARRAGIFCGYYTGIQRQHLGFSQYTVTTSDSDDLWEDAYVNAFRNAVLAERAATDEGIEGITIGIAQVLQAYAMGTVTSLFGDVPFAEAVDENVDNPAFQAQTEVYAQVQALLDQAIANLQSGKGKPVTGSDIYFNGDEDAWTEVAYTLKARFYMHTQEYANALNAASNGISTADNSMYAPHGTAQLQSNLTYQFFAIAVRGADVITSDLMASLVAPTEDVSPNIDNYRGNSKTNEAGRYNFYFKISNEGTQPNTEDGFAAATASAPMVTYQENLLIQAEAAFRTGGFDAGLARLNDFRAFMADGGYLENADMGEVQYDAYVAEDFAAGGIENADGLSANDALLREILEERYVTLFGQVEGFNDTRRTLKEATVRVPVQPNTGNQLPQRFIYPQSEIDRNANTPSPIPGFFEPTPINR